MALTLTSAELAEALAINNTLADRLLAVASALVTRHAPAAPDAVANEAALRCAGWLKDQPSSSVRSRSVGPLSADYSPSMTSALRHSGAMALLSPWKVRRGGAI